MNKKIAVLALVCCAAFLTVFSGCSLTGGQKQSGGKNFQNNSDGYAAYINERLLSFTECANAFSDSVEKIADRRYAPSDKQTAQMQENLDRLEKACAELSGLKAPAKYSEAQSALDRAMADYAEAIEKCSALLEFYGAYDDMFRKYNDPTEGSVEIGNNERALYGEFAEAMNKATYSFRAACKEFDRASKR